MNNLAPTIQALIRSINNSSTRKLAYARRQNLGKSAEELIQLDADRAKAHIRRMGIDFESAIPTEPQTARSNRHVNEFVKVRGYQRSLSEPQHFRKDDDEHLSTLDLLGRTAADASVGCVTGLCASLEIGGETADTIECEEVFDAQLILSLQKWCTEHALLEFLLYVQLNNQRQTDGSTVSTFEFHLVDARPLNTALQIVAPTPGEIQYARDVIAHKPDVMAHAMCLLIDYLQIVGLDRLPILREALAFMVIAAATEGDRGHAIIIGPPAVGKSIISKAGELLQPIFRCAMPTKITEAGLIGTGSSSKTGRKPGLVPMANQGAFSIQDFNQANSVKNQRSIAVFTDVMQEGRVVDASVSRCQYQAQVSIIVDANRRSDVRRKSSTKSGLDRLVEDIGIPTNVLSRTTYIAEIQRDAVAQIYVSDLMMRQNRNMSADERLVLEQQLRYLKVYLALARDEFRVVDISDAIRNYIADRVQEAISVTKRRLEDHEEYADYQTRLARQAHMLVAANARLNWRGEATTADVDAIMPYLWRKMDFLRTILFGGQTGDDDARAGEKARRRMIAWFVSKKQLARFRIADIRALTGMTSTTPATTEADLRALYGDPDSEGFFSVVAVLA